MTCECKQDFFIFVPTAHDAETFSHMADTVNEETASRHIKNVFHQESKSWIKIPLEGQVVVYARLSDKHVDIWNTLLLWGNA